MITKDRETHFLRVIFDDGSQPGEIANAAGMLKKLSGLTRETIINKYLKPAPVAEPKRKPRSKKTKVDLEDDILNLEKELGELEGENNELRKEIEGLEEEVAELNKDIKKLKNRNENLGSLVELLKIIILILLCFFMPLWTVIFISLFVLKLWNQIFMVVLPGIKLWLHNRK